jgi:hypothetical protein
VVRGVFNLVLRVAPHYGDFHFYSPRDAAGLVTDLGFEVVRIRRVGLWAFFLDAREPKLTDTQSSNQTES